LLNKKRHQLVANREDVMGERTLVSSVRAYLRGAGLFAAIATSFTLHAGAAIAQGWPSKAVTIIVPYGPGAANDIFTRAAASVLSKKFNVPFVIENRPGAGSIAGTLQVVRATPDGYTLLENSNAIASIGQGNASVKFDVRSDLTPIAMMASSSQAVMVPTSIGVNSMKEYIAYAKANESKTFFGVVGYGTFQHLKTVEMNNLVGINIKESVYNSASVMMTDLAAGRIHMVFSSVSTGAGLIADGKVKVLAYTGPAKGADIPAAPELKDVGINFAYSSSWSIYGPPGMSPALRDEINKAFTEACQDPAFIALAAKSNAAPTPISATELATQMAAEWQGVAESIKRTGISPQ
jgi:tripartite-type tricarboxylate transporter receptor subunit TctC